MAILVENGNIGTQRLSVPSEGYCQYCHHKNRVYVERRCPEYFTQKALKTRKDEHGWNG